MSDDAFWADAARQRHRAFGTPRGLSDQEMAREHRAQGIFFPALAQFQTRVRDAAALSCAMDSDFRHLLDAISDHAPTPIYWDEKLEAMR